MLRVAPLSSYTQELRMKTKRGPGEGWGLGLCDLLAFGLSQEVTSAWRLGSGVSVAWMALAVSTW